MADPKQVKVFDGTSWVDIKSDDPAEGKYVKLDGSSTMTGWLNTPGIQGNQKRDGNEDPNNPIQFIEVIEGGSDGGDPSDDYTQWLCKGDVYMGYVGNDPKQQYYKIKNLKTCEDNFDAANKKYVDDEVSKVTGSVTSVNGKTGAVVLDVKSLDDVCATVATDGQVLVWKDGVGDADGQWCPATPSSGGSATLSGLTDVCDTSPSDNQILTWDKDGGTDGSGQWCAEAAPVTSVNGKTGVVQLTASDVSAKPDSYEAPVTSVNGKTGVVQLTAADVSAKPDSYEAPVTSVNGKTGVVVLDVKSLSDVCDSDPTDGYVLTWKDGVADADGQWCATALPSQEPQTLPIYDDRNPTTVKLDSPSEKEFTVSTGGETRATIGGPDQLLKLADCTGYTGSVQYALLVNPSVPAECSSTFVSFRSSPNLTDKTATLLHVVSYHREGVGEQCGFYYGPSTTAYVKKGMVGFRSNQPGIDYAFLSDQAGVPSRFAGDVQTETVEGLADTDAKIGFTDVINFQFVNADTSLGSKVNVGYNESSGTGFANVGVGGCYFYCRDSKRLGIGATGINFNANAAADAPTYHWTMEPDGSFVGNSGSVVKTDIVTGPVDTDGEMNFRGTMQIKPSPDDATNTWTFRKDGGVGVGYFGQANIHLSLYNDFPETPVPQQWCYMAAPIFNAAATTSVISVESRPQFGTKAIPEVPEQGVPGEEGYVPPVPEVPAVEVAVPVYHFNCEDGRPEGIDFDSSQYGYRACSLQRSRTQNIGFISQVGLSGAKQNYNFFADGAAPSKFRGAIQVSTITGLAPDSDAKIDLGDNAIITGSVIGFNVGDPAKNITVGDNTSDVAGGDGVYITSRTHDLAFSSNGIRFNSNWTDGATVCHWLMKEDGGFVAYNTNSYITTPHVKGLEEDDAQIDLGSELRTTNHTPTQPNSIATKKYVDDAVSGAIWKGTQQEFDNIGAGNYDDDVLYCITN